MRDERTEKVRHQYNPVEIIGPRFSNNNNL